MSTNENDLLARIAARRAAGGAPDDLRKRIADRRAAMLQQKLFDPAVQAEDRAYKPGPDVDSTAGFTKGYARALGQGLTWGYGDEALAGWAGLGAMLPGGRSPAEAVEQTMDREAEAMRAFRERHPYASMAGELSGAVLSGAGALRAAPKLAGMPIRAAMAEGALYGSGTAEGGLTERAIGAGAGALLSGATAGAVKAVPRVARAVATPARAAALAGGLAGARSLTDDQPGAVDLVSDVGKAAAIVGGGVMGARKLGGAVSSRLAQRMGRDIVREAAEAGGVTTATAREAQRLAGPARAAEVRLMDLSDDLLGAARGSMGVFGSKARSELPELAAQRNAGRLGRTIGDLEEALAVPAGRSARTLRGLVSARASEADELYEVARALPDIDDANVGKLLDDDALRPFVNRARSMWGREEAAKIASGGTPEPWNPASVRAIDMVKRSMDDQISAARRSGQTNRARVLQGLRRSLLDPVDAARPEYASARGRFSAQSGPIDAIKMARGRMKGVPSFTRASVEEIADVTSGMDDMELALYKLSAIDDLKDSLGRVGGTEGRVLGKFGADSPEWQKLRMLVGSDEVMDRLAGRQGVETTFQTAADQLQPQRGSRTFFGDMDIKNFSDLSNLAKRALDEVLPNLSTSRAVADEVGSAMQLSGPDLIQYLDALGREVQAELVRRGRWDLAAAGLGTAAGAVAGPRLAGPGDRSERR